MIIVKLGGSVITDKSKYLAFREVTTRNITEVLSRLNEKMIIIHGGGSFGHIKAKEYGLPGSISDRTLTGLSVVHNDMMKLNQLIMDLLVSSGLRAVSVPPAAVFSGRRNYRQIYRLFEEGIIPVTHGDAYLTSHMVGIVSGDTIARDLARKYNPSRVVFLSDVDGVYNRNPKTDGDATLLSSLEDDVEFSEVVSDVTGGMKAKLSIMKKTAGFSGGVYLINGNHPERILDVGKKSFIGTAIRKER